MNKIGKIRCPKCGSYSYASYEEIYDGVWISLKSKCLTCGSIFQVNYRAVGIDILETPEFGGE